MSLTDIESVIRDLRGLSADHKAREGVLCTLFEDGKARAEKAEAELEVLKEHLEIRIRESQDGAWYWQGDGMDVPESLVCPVIMSANTLRALLATK